jgi:hypothetical protein
MAKKRREWSEAPIATILEISHTETTVAKWVKWLLVSVEQNIAVAARGFVRNVG